MDSLRPLIVVQFAEMFSDFLRPVFVRQISQSWIIVSQLRPSYGTESTKNKIISFKSLFKEIITFVSSINNIILRYTCDNYIICWALRIWHLLSLNILLFISISFLIKKLRVQ